MSDLHGAIERALKYLDTHNIPIPAETLKLAHQKGLAVKAGYADGGVPEITAQYNDEIVDALTTYFEGGSVTAPRNLYRSAMVEAFNSAFDTGWVDGGQELPPDEDALSWLSDRVEMESAYIAMLFQEAKELRKDAEFDFFAWVTKKADGYTRTVGEIYNAAVLLAKKNQLLEWHLGQTEKHCDTCASLNGTRHRASWYVARDYIPRKPGAGMDCKGYNCDCFLTDKSGEVVTL